MTQTSATKSVLSTTDGRLYVDSASQGPVASSAITSTITSIIGGAISAGLTYLLIESYHDGRSTALIAAAIAVLCTACAIAILNILGTKISSYKSGSKPQKLPQFISTEFGALRELKFMCSCSPKLLGIIEANTDSITHVYDNPAACRFFGSLPGVSSDSPLAAPVSLEHQSLEQLDTSGEIHRLWLSQSRECAARNAPVQFEFFTGIGPSKQWFSITLYPMTAALNEHHRFGYIGDDITALKESEVTLIETRDRLAAALEAGSLATWEWDIQRDLVYGDPTLLRLFGLPPEYSRGVPLNKILESVHTDDLDRIKSAIHKSLESGCIYSIEYRIILSDERIRWISANGQVHRNGSGKPSRFPGVAFDITHLKETEEALQKATQLAQQNLNELESVYTYAPIGMAVFDTEFRWLRVNKLMARFTGLTPKDHIGRLIWDILPDLKDELAPPLNRVLDTKVAVTNFIFSGESPCTPGLIRTWSSSFYPISNNSNEVVTIIMVTDDITEERRANEEHQAHRAILEQAAKGEPLNDILDSLAAAIERMFPKSICYMVRDHERGDCVVPLADQQRDLVNDIFSPPLESDPTGVFAQAIGNRAEVFLPDLTRSQSTPYTDRLLKHGINSCWIKPIILSNGEVWGACVVHHLIKMFKPTQAEQDHLDVLLQLAATVIERKRFYEQLLSTSERLQYAEQAGHIGVFDWNLGSNQVIWTTQMEDIFGIPQNSFEGTFAAWKKYIHPGDLAREEDYLKQRITERHPTFKHEYRIIREAGDIRWLTVEGAFTYDQAGIPERAIGIASDITERRNAEDRAHHDKERLDLVLEAGRLGFWDWHLPSGHVQFGGCWASMLGYDLSEIKSHVSSWELLVHPDDQAEINTVLSKHLRGESPFYECEHRLKKKDGSWMWVLDRGRVVERDTSGIPLRALGIHADVSEQHSIRESLKDASKRKDEFLAILAHELRNPLAPIRTGLEIIQRNPTGKPAEQARLMMSRQLSHMVRLIDDLLDVSRITRGQLELRKQQLSLQSVIASAIEASQPAIDSAHHQLITHLPTDPITLTGDPARLAQVVSNLLVNAAKYTPDGGVITVSLDSHESQARISVNDNGLGIPASMVEAIFEMFGQVNTSLHRSHGGLGIGLALVKKIVELHNGRIEVKSAGEGKGSTFTVYLPCHGSTHGDMPSSTDPILKSKEYKSEMKKVLIVDDNIDGATSLKIYLEMLGHSASMVHSGSAALEAVHHELPDIVFLDIGLPGISGYEVARAIRQMPAGHIPFIAAVTGWGTEEDKQKSADAGCNIHLTKPIDLSEAEKLLAAPH